ncbi:hypothetical protein J3R30DRAFT_1355211 [Lentinula aciculospora]|uniref:Uncharacterized protein n=1 Tax=Lentinula aciculospora TaxID=153920 RepID=A0A9W9DV06_9AGAR|nr:hypothetical protein J3R30DRAFT_1355211 [Lentinula aciculospora]
MLFGPQILASKYGESAMTSLQNYLDNIFIEHITSLRSFQSCVRALVFTRARSTRGLVKDRSTGKIQLRHRLPIKHAFDEDMYPRAVFTIALPFTNLRLLEFDRTLWPESDLIPFHQLISKNPWLERITLLGLRIGWREPSSEAVLLPYPEPVDAESDLIESILKCCPHLKDLRIETDTPFSTEHDAWDTNQQTVCNAEPRVTRTRMLAIQRLIILGYSVQLLRLTFLHTSFMGLRSIRLDSYIHVHTLLREAPQAARHITHLDTGLIVVNDGIDFEVHPNDWPDLKYLRFHWYGDKEISPHCRSAYTQLNELSLLLNVPEDIQRDTIDEWSRTVLETMTDIVLLEPRTTFVNAIRIVDVTGDAGPYEQHAWGTEISVNCAGHDWKWF